MTGRRQPARGRHRLATGAPTAHSYDLRSGDRLKSRAPVQTKLELTLAIGYYLGTL